MSKIKEVSENDINRVEMPWEKGLHEKERNWQLALGAEIKRRKLAGESLLFKFPLPN